MFAAVILRFLKLDPFDVSGDNNITFQDTTLQETHNIWFRMKHSRNRGIGWYGWMLVGAWLLVSASTAQAASTRPAPARQTKNAFLTTVQRLMRDHRGVLREIQSQHNAIVKTWIQLSEIPAPSRQEKHKAAFLAQLMKQAGLKVRVDKMGNVIGQYTGTGPTPRKAIVVCAHMDTVFDQTVRHKVRRQGTRLFGPGVLDNTVGLVNMVVVARMLRKYKVKLHQDVWFVGTVQEEIGLKGAQYLVKQHKKRIAMMIALDGGYGGISYGGIGIHWYRIEFHGQARHTLSSMGKPSTTHAAARAIAAIYQLKVPRKPRMQETWYNIGKLGGGKVVNAQAERAWFTVDLRSMNAQQLDRLEQKVFALARKTAKETGVTVRIVMLQKMPAVQLPGMRQHKLVQGTAAILKAQKARRIAIHPFGANDHCAGLAVGIPGINIGTTTGGSIHSLREWAESKHVTRGIQQTYLLILLMAGTSPNVNPPTTRR